MVDCSMTLELVSVKICVGGCSVAEYGITRHFTSEQQRIGLMFNFVIPSDFRESIQIFTISAFTNVYLITPCFCEKIVDY